MHYKIKTLFVLTKVDKLSKSKVAVQRKRIGDMLQVSEQALFTFSAKTREGREAIWDVILGITG